LAKDRVSSRREANEQKPRIGWTHLGLPQGPWRGLIEEGEYMEEEPSLSELLTGLAEVARLASERLPPDRGGSMNWGKHRAGAGARYRLALECVWLLQDQRCPISGTTNGLLYQTVADVWSYATGGDPEEVDLKRPVKTAARWYHDHAEQLTVVQHL
jgi:hypothetical protein